MHMAPCCGPGNFDGGIDAYDAAADLMASKDAAFKDMWPIGRLFRIEHDGFVGMIIGHYARRDGKRGIVGQQTGTNIVHVYGEKWLKPAEADGNKPS